MNQSGSAPTALPAPAPLVHGAHHPPHTPLSQSPHALLLQMSWGSRSSAPTQCSLAFCVCSIPRCCMWSSEFVLLLCASFHRDMVSSCLSHHAPSPHPLLLLLAPWSSAVWPLNGVLLPFSFMYCAPPWTHVRFPPLCPFLCCSLFDMGSVMEVLCGFGTLTFSCHISTLPSFSSPTFHFVRFFCVCLLFNLLSFPHFLTTHFVTAALPFFTLQAEKCASDPIYGARHTVGLAGSDNFISSHERCHSACGWVFCSTRPATLVCV